MRYHGLDAARAAAMLLGVFFHAAISFMATPLGWAVQDRSTHPGVDAFTWLVHAFRMPVFFLLSGFFSRLLVEKRGVDGFLQQRLLRLGLPLLLFWPPLAGALLQLWRWGRSLPGQPSAQGTPFDLPLDRLFLSPGHLWFLYYLLLIAVTASLLARYRMSEKLDRLRFVLPLGAAGLLCAMRPMEIETPISFVPDLRILGFYGIFFFSGWLLHRHPERIDGYGRHLVLRGALAVVLMAAAVPLLLRVAREHTLGPWHPAGALLLAALSWTLVGLVLGVFARFLASERRWMSWLSDASYWVYLVHLPVCVLLQVWLAPRAWPGPLKYALVSLGTLVFCLGTYAVGVRRTWMGVLLNGSRKLQ